MRMLLAVMLAACGTNDPGPHDAVACGSGWAHLSLSGDPNAVTPMPNSCEGACVEPQANYWTGGAQCSVKNNAAVCVYTTHDGVKGCCLPKPPTAQDDVTFVECDAQ